MFGIKRLYSYMLQRFLPLLSMTFFICLFIVLMQFLWKSIEDLVGKGLSVGVICELFFYAALSMVPTALPLAVLLASLMVFGNLGEKFELTAMKASGISLFRIMRPLIVFMAFLAVGAFFFQNDVLPIAKTKMWTLLFSVRQKSPEVEIPVRSFYDQIPNMNLYTESKNPETGMLYGMILYDLSRGYDNTRVIQLHRRQDTPLPAPLQRRNVREYARQLHGGKLVALYALPARALRRQADIFPIRRQLQPHRRRRHAQPVHRPECASAYALHRP